MAEQALFRIEPRGIARTHTYQLHDDFFVFGPIKVMHASRVLHETAGFEGNRLVRREFVACARVPCTLDDRRIPVFTVKVWSAHHAWWKLNLDDVEAGLLGIAFNDSGLE